MDFAFLGWVINAIKSIIATMDSIYILGQSMLKWSIELAIYSVIIATILKNMFNREVEERIRGLKNGD